MKYRNGFVSNSSSMSFVIDCEKLSAQKKLDILVDFDDVVYEVLEAYDLYTGFFNRKQIAGQIAIQYLRENNEMVGGGSDHNYFGFLDSADAFWCEVMDVLGVTDYFEWRVC